MSQPHDVRLRLERLPAFLDGLDREVREARVKAWVVGLGIVFGAGAAGVALTLATDGGAFVCIVFAVIIGLVLLVSMLRRAGRNGEKVAFLRELLDALHDELHPKAKVHVRFDLRHYDEASKRTWTGKSIYGNPKAKYSDKWLHLEARLADGSEVRIVRQAGVKTKSGSIQKEKRRLFLAFEPNPWLYRLPPGDTHGDLAQRLRTRIPKALHDPPEGFAVKLDGGDGKFRLKITQEDAPVLPSEVLFAIWEVLDYLAPRKVG